MRLTDYCLIFAAMFVCLFLGRDLMIADLCARRLTTVAYERQMDRIAEDALMDVVETQGRDGAPIVRTGQIYEQYRHFLSCAYDLTEDDCRERAWEAVTLWEFSQYPYALTAQELDEIRDGLEQQINSRKRLRRELTHFALAFPYRSGGEWSQTLYGSQLLTVFDPWDVHAGYDRAAFSGSRIVKLTVEQ